MVGLLVSAMPIISLGKRSVYSFRGPDAVRYLNGQVTQDVRKLLAQPSEALATCVTDAKGKLQAFATLYLIDAAVPEIRLEADISLREFLLGRLTRYLIADDVEVEDQSDEWLLLHRVGDRSEESGYQMNRYGNAGLDFWWPAQAALSAEILNEEAMESQRIERGIPRWGRELEQGMLPPEAGIDEVSISYHKGCYIGQEVISRIKSAGKLNRRLQKFTLSSNRAAVGSALLNGDDELGVLTSVSFPHALGYLGKKGIGQTKFDLRLPDGEVILAAASCGD